MWINICTSISFQSFFGFHFGNNADIDIILDDQENRKMADIRDENGRKERLYLFYDGEAVSGKVGLHPTLDIFRPLIHYSL